MNRCGGWGFFNKLFMRTVEQNREYQNEWYRKNAEKISKRRYKRYRKSDKYKEIQKRKKLELKREKKAKEEWEFEMTKRRFYENKDANKYCGKAENLCSSRHNKDLWRDIVYILYTIDLIKKL